MLRLVVGALINLTLSAVKCILRQSRCSSVRGRVAVRSTICVRMAARRPSRCRGARNLLLPSSTVWHLSITIRARRPVTRILFMNVWKASSLTASGVMNTIDAASAGLRPSYATTCSPANSHLCRRSCRRESSGTTTIVRPALSQAAGSINIRLLPPPVGIIITTGLSPRKIAWIPTCCAPRNSACSLYIALNCVVALTVLRPRHLIRLALPVRSIGMTRFRGPEEVFTVLGGRKARKACHSILNLWNRCLLLAVVLVNSPIRRAYTVSPIRAVWPACSSYIVSKDPSSSFSELLSSSSSLVNAD